MKQQSHFKLDIREDIYIYRVSAITRDVVDQLFAADQAQNEHAMRTTKHALRLWVIEKLLFPTPYLKAKIDQGVRVAPPDLNVSIAIVLRDQIALRVLSFFIQRIMNNRPNTTMRIFNDEPTAIEWLNHQRDESAAA